ncbi:hypothetical protein Hanom_Chr07g00616631 [Helianthus anomalus]
MPEMEPEGVGTGGSGKADERLHGEYGDNERMHGENNGVHVAANMSHSPSVLERTWGKSEPPFDFNKSIESFSVGSSKVESEVRSKKRPRRCRSPCEGEIGGPVGQEDGSTFNPLRELIKKSKVNEEAAKPNSVNGGQDKGNSEHGESAAMGDAGGLNSDHDDGPRLNHMGNSQVSAPGEGLDAEVNKVDRDEGDSIQQETVATMEIG